MFKVSQINDRININLSSERKYKDMSIETGTNMSKERRLGGMVRCMLNMCLIRFKLNQYLPEVVKKSVLTAYQL